MDNTYNTMQFIAIMVRSHLIRGLGSSAAGVADLSCGSIEAGVPDSLIGSRYRSDLGNVKLHPLHLLFFLTLTIKMRRLKTSCRLPTVYGTGWNWHVHVRQDARSISADGTDSSDFCQGFVELLAISCLL
jgi:hypothetical protein